MIRIEETASSDMIGGWVRRGPAPWPCAWPLYDAALQATKYDLELKIAVLRPGAVHVDVNKPVVLSETERQTVFS